MTANSLQTASYLRNSMWQHLLQIAGTISIVAFHTQAPCSQAGWVAVEMFFVLAGMHMTSVLNRGDPVVSYARSRMTRLFPELAVVWVATVGCVILSGATDGMLWFIATSPFQLQNLTPLFFNYNLPRDAIFGPLWFLGSLFQIQLLLCGLKGYLKRFKPVLIITVSLLAGVLSRLLFGLLSGHPISLDGAHAGILYCMPFCHIEAVVLGVLISNGDLAGMARKMPLIVGLVLLAGQLNYQFSPEKTHAGSLGFEFPLRQNLSHLWGYPALAFAAASLCARYTGRLHGIARVNPPSWITSRTSRIAALTYGVYCFHGIIISTNMNGTELLDQSKESRLLIFAITLLESFLLAWAFTGLKERDIFIRCQHGTKILITRAMSTWRNVI